MNVPKGWNINTTIAVCGFSLTLFVSLIGWVSSTATFKASVDEMARKYDGWIVNHELLHKDRLATVSAIEARTDQRITTLELATRKVEQIEYRLTIQEQGSQNLTRSVEELKNAVNSQSADLKVIREILSRLDPRAAQVR